MGETAEGMVGAVFNCNYGFIEVQCRCLFFNILATTANCMMAAVDDMAMSKVEQEHTSAISPGSGCFAVQLTDTWLKG